MTTPSKNNKTIVDLTDDDFTGSPTSNTPSFKRRVDQISTINATSVPRQKPPQFLFKPSLSRGVVANSVPPSPSSRSSGVLLGSTTPTTVHAVDRAPLFQKVVCNIEGAPTRFTATSSNYDEENSPSKRQKVKNPDTADELSSFETSTLVNDDLPVSKVAAGVAYINLADDNDDGHNKHDVSTQTVSPFHDIQFSFRIQSPIINLESSAEHTIRTHKIFNRCTSYKSGDVIEFTDGSFMRVKRVIENDWQPDDLLGQLFKRLDDSNNQAPKGRINEIVWVAAPPTKHPRGYVQIPLIRDNILRSRIIILTNERYPAMSAMRPKEETISDGNGLSPLYCRWKLMQVMEDGRAIEEVWTALTPDESDSETCMSRENLRGIWRCSDTIAGGTHVRHTTFREVYDVDCRATVLDLDADESTVQSYTFGDAFCGAGGTSWGAYTAGLRVQWSFDLDKQACDTYRLNQPETDCRNLGVDEFIASGMVEDFKVDVLHLSPPCQPFSPANTTPNILKNEANQAPLFAIPQLLEIAKPRVVTLEETEGMQNRHSPWFNALLRMFLETGYSLRWRILWCRDYDVPQIRRRLVIVAAGPGEVLPPFPAPTHARLEKPTPGLPQTSHINKALESIPPNASLMDTAEIYEKPKAPHSGFDYAKTVTCGGGDNWHPSGLRSYHIRELAALQTFPPKFRFVGEPNTIGNISVWRRQIGNAVPPKMAEAVYRCIIKTLKEVDGV